MTGVFDPHIDILPVAQKRLWPELHKAASLGFVLYGGTAIALRLGHRTSVDFDFFTDKPLDRKVLQESFPFLSESTTLQDEPNAYSVLVPYGDSVHPHVKVSFFGQISFGRVSIPEYTSDGVLQVASFLDLMATKLKVILQRAEAKDYKDIAEMIHSGVNLPEGLASAQALFGKDFQPSESLKALVYFEDGDLRTLTNDEKHTLIKAAKEVRELPPIVLCTKQLALRTEEEGSIGSLQPVMPE